MRFETDTNDCVLQTTSEWPRPDNKKNTSLKDVNSHNNHGGLHGDKCCKSGRDTGSLETVQTWLYWQGPPKSINGTLLPSSQIQWRTNLAKIEQYVEQARSHVAPTVTDTKPKLSVFGIWALICTGMLHHYITSWTRCCVDPKYSRPKTHSQDIRQTAWLPHRFAVTAAQPQRYDVGVQ